MRTKDAPCKLLATARSTFRVMIIIIIVMDRNPLEVERGKQCFLPSLSSASDTEHSTTNNVRKARALYPKIIGLSLHFYPRLACSLQTRVRINACDARTTSIAFWLIRLKLKHSK